MMNLRNIVLWLFIALIVFGLFNLFSNTSGDRNTVDLTYSQFLDEVEAGSIKDVIIRGNNINGAFEDGRSFKTYAANDPTLVERLNDRGVNISAAPLDDGYPSLLGVLISWFPMLLLIGVWIFFMRQMQGGRGGAMGFGRSKAKLLTENKNKVTFNDVAGIDEAKEELVEIVEFLKDPRKFQKLGGRIPKGALLIGPPGTGKTLLARAVAGEAGVPFFTISGSDFVEMFVGVGASRVRDMFEQAKRSAPCIIFIDEIDAVGRHRGAGLGGGNDEREQTLNQLLTEMDGFASADKPVIVLAATNQPEVLDAALLRPGRFDRQVLVDRPDLSGRKTILEIYTKKVKLADSIDLDSIAQATSGFAGADLANMVNEAALLAARAKRKSVEQQDLSEAIERVVAGLEKKSRVLQDEEKKVVAYHEVGHAIVGHLMPGGSKVAKISIVPRGMSALGYTLQLPTEERFLNSKEELKGQIATLLGGRSAEEVVFGKITTGASNDLQRATDIAEQMVGTFGMSDILGPLAYDKQGGGQFLGNGNNPRRSVSDATAQAIDKEVRDLVDDAHETALNILRNNLPLLESISQKILQEEVIEGEDLKNLLAESKMPA